VLNNGAHLSEFADLNLDSATVMNTRNGFDSNLVAVRQGVEQIISRLSSGPALLGAKNEVNP
jgi:hypothetical protein